MSTNLELWTRVFTTDPLAVKSITGKQYSGNSPKPYWIVEQLTAEFGPCGIGWGFTILSERMERMTETDILHIAVLRFWYVLGGKRGELEQVGQTKAAYMTSKGTMLIDEDAPKKSVTDALVKCASYLGFAGDIFSGRWDDSKYVKAAGEEWAARRKALPDGPIKPTDGAMAALSPDQQAWVAECADRVKRGYANLGPDAAADYIAEQAFEATEETAFWSLLQSESAMRAAIKVAQENKRASAA